MIIFFILFIFFLALLMLLYRIAFYSRSRGRTEDIYDIPTSAQYQPKREHMRRLIEDFAAVPFEVVEITSRDGLPLRARYYHSADSAPLEIQFHGYRGSAIRDFCGGAPLGLSLGHNVLLVDQRAHGASGGSTISFGIKERYDVLDWVAYARKRFGADVPIGLYGVSMGAATVLMAAGLELPDNVRGVVADCPYSSPEAIIRKVAREDMHLPAALAMPFIRLSARLFGRYSIREASAVEAVRKAKIPILVIHGEDDRFVPCAMSREIHAANPDLVTLETFPEAGHGLSYIVDPKRYKHLVVGFEKEILR